MAAVSNKAEAKIVASSSTYRFLVGADKEEFFVHAQLLGYNSPVLGAMINSSFAENVEKTVKWDDIDVRTFVSFWQFLYTGTYDDPVLSTAVPQKPISDIAVKSHPDRGQFTGDLSKPDDAEGWGITSTKRKMKKKKNIAVSCSWYPPTHSDSTTKKSLLSEFERLGVSDFLPRGALWNQSNEATRREEVASHGDIFTHHAQVATLADRYDMPRLASLALSRLQQCLKCYNIDRSGPSEVVALLQFCFMEPRYEMLRQLVVLYAACHTRKLWACDAFGDLIESSGAFARAIMGYMMQRIDETDEQPEKPDFTSGFVFDSLRQL